MPKGSGAQRFVTGNTTLLIWGAIGVGLFIAYKRGAFRALGAKAQGLFAGIPGSGASAGGGAATYYPGDPGTIQYPHVTQTPATTEAIINATPSRSSPYSIVITKDPNPTYDAYAGVADYSVLVPALQKQSDRESALLTELIRADASPSTIQQNLDLFSPNRAVVVTAPMTGAQAGAAPAIGAAAAGGSSVHGPTDYTGSGVSNARALLPALQSAAARAAAIAAATTRNN